MDRIRRTGTIGAAALAVAGCVTAGVLATAPGSTAATASGRVPECGANDLTASYRGGQGAAGHVLGRIVLENTGGRTCSVKGYGGLSYVGGGNGTQVGAAADRTPSATPRRVLRPGQKVRSAVSEAQAGDYSAQQCGPTAVDGFRVYVPDSTTALYVAHPTTGCANTAVHLLQHKAYR